MPSEHIILGIDPGTTIMGFGVIKTFDKNIELLQLNELNLKKYDDHYTKLRYIFERCIHLIETFHPDHIAIEAPFFGKNVQSMLKVGTCARNCYGCGLITPNPDYRIFSKKD